MIALGRAEDFSGKEEPCGKFKNVLVSFCGIGRISQTKRVDRIAEDFHYFPVLGYKDDGLAFRGNDPYISIPIQCDSGSTFKIGMGDKDVIETESVGGEGSIATSFAL